MNVKKSRFLMALSFPSKQLMQKSSKEIRSWEANLIACTQKLMTYLDHMKQDFSKQHQKGEVSSIKKKQRAILLSIERDRLELRKSYESDRMDGKLDTSLNDSETRENIRR